MNGRKNEKRRKFGSNQFPLHGYPNVNIPGTARIRNLVASVRVTSSVVLVSVSVTTTPLVSPGGGGGHVGDSDNVVGAGGRRGGDSRSFQSGGAG